MKFTRTITITKIERQIVRVVASPGSPDDPCQAPTEALPVAEESLGLPADASAASKPEQGMRRKPK
jgi:hypothetical protein